MYMIYICIYVEYTRLWYGYQQMAKGLTTI